MPPGRPVSTGRQERLDRPEAGSARPVEGPGLGHQERRPCRSHSQLLANPAVYRSQGPFQIRPAAGLQTQEGRTPVRHVRGGIHSRGDHCSFETLVHHFGLKDPALRALGEMVHDIDCKDGKFRRAETTGLQRLIQGIVAANGKDTARLRQGAVILDSFYDAFASRRK